MRASGKSTPSVVCRYFGTGDAPLTAADVVVGNLPGALGRVVAHGSDLIAARRAARQGLDTAGADCEHFATYYRSPIAFYYDTSFLLLRLWRPRWGCIREPEGQQRGGTRFRNRE